NHGLTAVQLLLQSRSARSPIAGGPALRHQTDSSTTMTGYGSVRKPTGRRHNFETTGSTRFQLADSSRPYTRPTGSITFYPHGRATSHREHRTMAASGMTGGPMVLSLNPPTGWVLIVCAV